MKVWMKRGKEEAVAEEGGDAAAVVEVTPIAVPRKIILRDKEERRSFTAIFLRFL